MLPHTQFASALTPFLRLTLLVLASFATARTATPAPVGGPNVAIVTAEVSLTGLNNTDPQSRLQASGLFGQVDIIDARLSTPTLAQLLSYSAVMTWSNYSYSNSTTLGNVLADYVDAGGGVVVATYANSDTNATRSLQGRWLTGGYAVIVQQGGTHTGASGLGNILDQAHPIMAGVTGFAGGTSSFRPQTTSLTAGAHLIATWIDGRILVAEHGSLAQRVDLGFFPPSNLAQGTSWIWTTDGGKLLSNALFYVASNNGFPVPFCSGDGSATACPCANFGFAGNGCSNSVEQRGANLLTSGVPRLSNDTLLLSAIGMPNGPALYLQGLTQSNGGAGFQFGDGLRCVGSPIVRLSHAMNVAGASHYPTSVDPNISSVGAVTAPGTRTYQVWFRDAAPFCTTSTFNLTNGVQVTWVN